VSDAETTARLIAEANRLAERARQQAEQMRQAQAAVNETAAHLARLAEMTRNNR